MVFLWELARSRSESVVRSETLNFWEGVSVMPPCVLVGLPQGRVQKRKNVIKRRMPSRAFISLICINICGDVGILGTGTALEGPIIYLSWFSVRFTPFWRARPHTVLFRVYRRAQASPQSPRARACFQASRRRGPTVNLNPSHGFARARRIQLPSRALSLVEIPVPVVVIIIPTVYQRDFQVINVSGRTR